MRNALFIFLLSILICSCVFFSCTSKKPPATGPGQAAVNPEDFTEEDAAGAEQFKQQIEQMRVEVKQKRRTYLLGPGDIIKLTVWMHEDLSKEGVIRDDGTYHVHLVGNVNTEGMTVTQFQATVTKALAEYVQKPQVDAEIITYNSKFFYLVGQLREPGLYPITATTTVMEAISQGKGFTEKANLGEAYLIHNKDIVPVDFVSLFKSGRMENNIHLDDGDVIYVPSTDISRVYVMGEVQRPAAVPVRTGRISLAEAISEAGGFNETTAFKSAIRIIRGNFTNPEVLEVNFNDIVKGKAVDYVYLKPGDIVYVPASGLAKWDRVMGLILPSLSRLVVDAAAIDSLTNE